MLPTRSQAKSRSRRQKSMGSMNGYCDPKYAVLMQTWRLGLRE